MRGWSCEEAPLVRLWRGRDGGESNRGDEGVPESPGLPRVEDLTGMRTGGHEDSSEKAGCVRLMKAGCCLPYRRHDLPSRLWLEE